MGEPFVGAMGAKFAPPPKTAWLMPRPVGDMPESMFVRWAVLRHQLTIGSCTGFCFGAVSQVVSGIGMIPSPLALYWYFRKESGLPTDQDTGAYMEPAVRALMKYGIGSESLWPYNPADFAKEPSALYQQQALDHLATHYYRALTVDQVKAAILNGYAIAGSFDVPQGFEEVGETGEWLDKGGPALGGHAVAIIGYDDMHNGGCLLVQNSWGNTWGAAHPHEPGGSLGYFWVPYDAYEYGTRWWDGIVVTKMDLD